MSDEPKKEYARHPNGKPIMNGNQMGTGFTSDRQPANVGRKKTLQIKKLMRAFGRSLAPEDIRNDEKIKAFLDQTGLKGTIHEVLVARLYAMAFYANDSNAIKSMRLIIDVLNGKRDPQGKNTGLVTINFIAPQAQETPEDLSSDSWSVMENQVKN